MNNGKARRKLLKSVAITGSVIVGAKSLPKNWAKPVVKSVLLPAHAQTSGFVLSCVSTAAPFGSSVPPGPFVDVTNGFPDLPVLVTVTPAPGTAINTFQSEVFIDSVSQIPSTETLAADGTYPTTYTFAVPGRIEIRYTYQGQQCSLFWNLQTN